MLETAPTLLVVALFAVGFYMFTLGSKIKQLALNGLEGEYRRVEPKNLPGMNQRGLSEITVRYESLGFTFITDFTIVRPKMQIVSGFSRLFFNREARCSATVFQLFDAQGQFLRTNQLLASKLEGGLNVVSCNFAPLAANWVMRHPRQIGGFVRVGVTTDFFTAHLRIRDRMATDFGLQIVPPVSFEDYIDQLRKLTNERIDLLRMKSGVQCGIEYYCAKIWPKHEWWGEYGLPRKK